MQGESNYLTGVGTKLWRRCLNLSAVVDNATSRIVGRRRAATQQRVNRSRR